MPVDPRPTIGGEIARHHPVDPPMPAVDRGFRAELAQAAAVDPAAEPAPRRGLDGRERTQSFVRREAPQGGGEGSWMFGEDGFDFGDLIDIVNPLQHIPVVSSVYRWLTGDEISPAARMAGGALFGGPIGLAGSVANLVIDETTGRDLGEHAMAIVLGAEEEAPAELDMGNLADAGGPEPGTPPAPAAAAAASQVAAAHAGGRFIALQPAGGATPAAPFIPVASSPSDPAAQPAAPRPQASAAVVAPPSPSPGAEGAEAEGFGAIVAEDMMLALDKYEALLRSRDAGHAPPPSGPAAGSLYDASI